MGKAAMRLAIGEVVDGVAVHDEAKQERGWKLFLLLLGCCFKEGTPSKRG